MHINVTIKQHKFHSITARKNRYLIAKTMRMSTEQDMIVVIAEATTNASREEGVGRGCWGWETVGGSREEATLASKSSLITPLSSRLFQLIATRRGLLFPFTRLQPAFRLMRPSWYLIPLMYMRVIVFEKEKREREIFAIIKFCSINEEYSTTFDKCLIIMNIN